MKKPYILKGVYVIGKEYKQLLKHIGSQAFSKFVREKIQEELDSETHKHKYESIGFSLNGNLLECVGCKHRTYVDKKGLKTSIEQPVKMLKKKK